MTASTTAPALPALIRPNRLREHREAMRLTLDEMSQLTGFDASTISKHESGARGLGREAIARYTRVMKVESWELFMQPEELGAEEDVPA